MLAPAPLAQLVCSAAALSLRAKMLLAHRPRPQENRQLPLLHCISMPILPADKLLALLETPSEGQEGVPEQETTYGMLKPPLGSTRLTAIALVAVLLRTGQQVAEQAIMASGQCPPAMPWLSPSSTERVELLE